MTVRPTLVVGGSGTLGRLVVERLVAAGQSVRVMTRRPSVVARVDNRVEVVSGDLLDADSVARACDHVDAVVCAAHSILGRGRSASEHIDGSAHRRLIDSAKASGVRQIVYTSVYQPAPEYASIPFFRIKREVEGYLRASGVPHTILRPTAFMDFHAHVLLGRPVLEGKRVMLFGTGDRPRNFVAARDVATFVEMALDAKMANGDIVEIGGPENLSPRDVIAVYERASGRTATVTRVPRGLARAVAAMMQPVHPGVSQIVRMAVLADTVDRPFDARPLLGQYPVALTSLQDWVSGQVP